MAPKARVFDQGLHDVLSSKAGGWEQTLDGGTESVFKRFRIILLDTAYTFNRGTQEYVDDIVANEVEAGGTPSYWVDGHRPDAFSAVEWNKQDWEYDLEWLTMSRVSVSPSYSPDTGFGISLGNLAVTEDVGALVIYREVRWLIGGLKEEYSPLLFAITDLGWTTSLMDGKRKFSVVFPGGLGLHGILFSVEKDRSWPLVT